MAESIVNVTEGSGKKLHTFNRTIGANSVEDEVILHGMPYYATYAVTFSGISTATGSSHILQIMAGASLNVYVHEVRAFQAAAATTAAFLEWKILRVTSAGTGGTAVTPTAHDTTDAAAGCTAMTLPTVKGTEATWPFDIQNSYMTQTPGAAGVAFKPVYEWIADGKLWKPIRIPAGAANGIVLRNGAAVAGATVSGRILVTEANF